MTIAAGSRLGPYEVLSSLGAGGMGEVWRARDSRLARDVAIKVLPAAVASDPERLKRFEKEARSASALNHPAIVTIYDVGVTDGVSWIAMELVEGKTLRARRAPGSRDAFRPLGSTSIAGGPFHRMAGGSFSRAGPRVALPGSTRWMRREESPIL